MKIHFRAQEFLLYPLSVVLTLCILFLAYYQHGFDFSLPLMYQEDSLFSSMLIKSVIDTGWYINNPYLGLPSGFNMVDYPLVESANFLIIKVLSFFSQNTFVILNFFYFLTYPLVTLFSLFTLRKLGLNRIFAIVGSLLFAFLPYHYIRSESHLFLTTYYVIPIYVLLIFSVIRGNLFLEQGRFSWLKLTLTGIACLFAASSGVYYAFFACYLILIAGSFSSVNSKKLRPLIQGFLVIIFIISVIFINLIPTLSSKIQFGTNTDIAVRNPSESEIIGLKITQMLFPVDHHRIQSFATFKKQYAGTAPLINENRSATLGFIGSLGFLFLVAFVFYKRKLEFEKKFNDILFNLSCLNLSALLLGTIGGFGAIFNYLISPTIRSYNRISVFIAFFSFCGFFLILQYLIKKFKPQHYIAICFVTGAILLVFGIYDQIGQSGIKPDYKKIADEVKNDKEFVNQIEKIMPHSAMIFQLPISPFPENETIYRMNDYSLFRGYLYSKTLKWSYGAIRGGRTLVWQQQITNDLKNADFLNEIIYAGFTGLYINREGFPDSAHTLEKKLISLLKEKPIVSEDNKLVFYDLRDYKIKLQKSMLASNWLAHLNKTSTQLKINFSWKDGFSSIESLNQENWRWVDNNGTLQITNFDTKPISIHIYFQLQSGYPEKSNLFLSGDLVNQTFQINNIPFTIDKKLVISPGVHYIYFKSDAKKIDSSEDIRELYFRLNNFKEEII